MNRIDYISLIYKNLSNEISADELLLLNEWLNFSNENKSEAEDLALIWDQAEIAVHEMEALAGDVNLDREFSLLNSRIQEEAKTETKIIRMPRRRKWAIAAGFALLIGITASVLLFNNFNNAVEWSETEAGDQTQEILLADGSKVHLNANSSLRYPESFSGDSREVELKGEGFFEITKDAAHPFIVHTPYEDITVLGTSFNVRAYENEPNSEVVVSTGKVDVNSGVARTVLMPNEKAIVDHSSGVMGLEKTTSLNESAWHTKTIQFSNTPLPEVLDDLEAFYHVELSFTNPDLVNCVFTSNFVNDNLTTVLETISTVLDVNINEKSNGSYVLEGGGCK